MPRTKTKRLKPWMPAPTTIEHVDAMTAERGWFREQLWTVESSIWGRWNYWLQIIMNGQIGDPERFPIPQIEFGQFLAESTPAAPAHLVERFDHEFVATTIGTSDEARKIIHKSFETAIHIGGDNLDRLIEWWLWAFGSGAVKERPKLSDKAAIAMYQLQLPRMIAHPADWASWLVTEFACVNRAAWFPTPMSLCSLMAQMTFGNHDGDTRALTVNEPCVGTGAILLPISNYSLRMSCQDVDYLMVRLCEFQAWLWIPWLVLPGDAFGVKWETEDVSEGNVRKGATERVAQTKEPVETGVKFVQGQLF